jgi:hypothetical protein
MPLLGSFLSLFPAPRKRGPNLSAEAAVASATIPVVEYNAVEVNTAGLAQPFLLPLSA